jgi:hypothetical protein
VIVKVTEFSQDFLHCRLARYGNGWSKDNLIPQFPKDKEALPEKAENVSDPLGPSISHMTMGVLLLAQENIEDQPRGETYGPGIADPTQFDSVGRPAGTMLEEIDLDRVGDCPGTSSRGRSREL